MSQPLSHWRQRARREITEALAALPVTATRKDAERCVRQRCGHWHQDTQFGTSWPYQCFLRERKAILDRLYPKPREKATREVIRYVLTPFAAGSSLAKLTVLCGWCDNRLVGGCLQCGGHWDAAHEVIADRVFLDLRKSVGPNRDSWGILADWVSERLAVEVEVVA